MPNLTISINDTKPIADLVAVQEPFAFLASPSLRLHESLSWERGKRITRDLQVMVAGKTGHGKSSLLNALVGRSLFATSGCEVCTRKMESCEFQLPSHPNHYFSLVDLPGIGESEKMDSTYLSWYSNLLKKSEVILYVLRADQRDFSTDLNAFKSVLPDPGKLVVVLNQMDKIEPVTRKISGQLTVEQSRNLKRMIRHIAQTLDIKESTIFPVSSTQNWEVTRLVKVLAHKLQHSPRVKL
jgi:small GTP-binding protein